MWPNSVSNVLWSVSVRTRVPEMNVTPSTMARPVRARRNLWASRPLTVTVHMSAAEPLHPLQNRIGGRRGELSLNLAVGQEHDAVRVGRAARIVRDHDDRLPELRHRATEEGQHLGRRVRVEVAGGLVGEDEVRPVDECPGTGGTLLLAPGHLSRS